MTDRAGGGRMFPTSWGAMFIGEGKARFRLWAPGLEKLNLRLDGADLPMRRVADGWFEATATGARPGQEYAFVLPDGLAVPDPASRAQAGDVHGPSLLVDPTVYRWRNSQWRGRPWREAVIYELHIGTFTPEGTFRAAADRLAHLAQLGVTAVEVMPVAQFPGTRGWGYDGVLPYAPHSAYGTPDDLRHLVDEAHGLGLMMLLDVVYNHFGPDGNYLSLYVPDFFDPDRRTPWGDAIAYQRSPVRQFFIENALYWLDEYNLDGLRLDAVDQIRDPSEPELLVELAQQVRAAFPDREIHLTTEDNRNVTHLHERSDGRTVLHTAEWNDDFHNAAHVVLTGESEGYYEDFADVPLRHLARSLAEGFAYQGEASAHAGGEARGAPSGHLPPTAFIDFLQNHDQVGNRAKGERLTELADPRALEAMTAVLLLSPHIPLIFMGEEWGETKPFCFFTDYKGELADAVRRGRREEFAGFAAFADSEDRDAIPDPNAPVTFETSKLDWAGMDTPEGRRRLWLYRSLLGLRQQHVVPLLGDAHAAGGTVLSDTDGMLAVDWTLAGARLQVRANLSGKVRDVPGFEGQAIYASDTAQIHGGQLAPNSVIVAVAR